MAQQSASKLPTQSSLSINDEDDAAVSADFLGIKREIVKTAREPKAPKDYVDSSKDVIAAADKQKNKKKGNIRHGPSISVANDKKLEVNQDDSKKDDPKEATKSDDKNKKKEDK